MMVLGPQCLVVDVNNYFTILIKNFCYNIDGQVMCDYSKLYLPTRSRITRMNFKFSEHNRQLHMVG
jgi:hypothetical protein